MEKEISEILEEFRTEHREGKITSQEGNFSPLIYSTAY